MAYFMWTDASVTELIGSVDKGYDYGGKKIALVELLPKPVEIADVFRVVVCNTIGGVVSEAVLRVRYTNPDISVIVRRHRYDSSTRTG